MTKTSSATIGLEKIAGQELSQVRIQPKVLRQVVLGILNNQRQSTAHTKRRGEVSGGGKKPWRQKGTGRARTGSIRNPLWRGGGITFGPTNAANFSHMLPTQLKRQALMMALKSKVDAGQLARLTLEQPLTKVGDIKANAPELLVLRNALVVIPEATWAKGLRNLSNLTPVSLNRVNALIVARAHHVVFINDTYSQLLNRVKHA
ncbi:MAG: 50S ribosomal protein L4 [Patescibacteria group bacterium]|nr:50S ribosomal protein L4 [Patescibacteria group bacterium]